MEPNFSEREMDVLDMFWAVCQRWRCILIGAVVAAILFAGVSYLKSGQVTPVEEAETEIETGTEAEPEKEKIVITADDKENVRLYFDYVDAYADQLRYNQTSPLMQLDAKGFYVGTLDYFVDNHFKVEYPVIGETNQVLALIQAYQSLLNDEDFILKLQNELKITDEKEAAYIVEHVDCSNRYGSKTGVSNDRGVVRISVYAQEEDTCQILIRLVQDTLEQNKDTISGQFENHDLSLLGETCKFVADSGLLAFQKENFDKLYNYRTGANNVKNLLPEALRTRVVGLAVEERENPDLFNFEEENAEDEESKEEVTPEQLGPVSEIPEKKVSVASVIAGFVIGALLVFVFQVLAYIFDNKLRFEDDFERLYQIKLLGKVEKQEQNRKRNFVDERLLKLRRAGLHHFEEKELLDVVSAEIRVSAKKENAKNLYMMGLYLTKENQLFADEITNKAKQTGLQIQSGDAILYHADSLAAMSEMDATILLIRAGDSRYDEVLRIKNKCKTLGVTILGAIVME